MGEINRRDFIKAGVLGGAAAVAGLGGLNSEAEGASATPAPVYRTLGRTGLKITVISFGAMLTPEAEVIRAGLDRGINYIDTARRYMNGNNEGIVAQAVKGRRDNVHLATKARPTSDTKKEIFRDVEESLTALQTDHIDVLQLHSLKSRERAFIPEVREALVQLRQQGKVRFFGVTTHTNQAEVVNALADDPDRFFDMALVGYNFKSPPEIRQAIARAAKAGIGIIAMKTQAGGYQTAALGSLSPHQAALKWALQDPNVAAAIPGMKDLAQLQEDMSVMGLALTRRDEQILKRYGQAINPYYCQLCGRCAESCSRKVAISDINRSLMYAEAYGNMELARETYREIPVRASLKSCLDCSVCTASCVNGIDIPAKLERAGRILV
ncbi:MAG: aldo/keto reductase [Deltaproteobacteria bacterium]|nr:aldo/keto reductase [Deltaproteobacteria bacterium]